MRERTDSKPWYKQFWPWFIIALPATSVVAGLTTVVIAVKHKPDVVRDDWYKDGVAIQQRKDMHQRAVALGIGFAYSLDRTAGKLLLKAAGVDTASTPVLSVYLQHPTIAERDIDATAALMPDGQYAVLMNPVPDHDYHIRIRAPGADWQVDGRIPFSRNDAAGQLN